MQYGLEHRSFFSVCVLLVLCIYCISIALFVKKEKKDKNNIT